MAGLPLWWASLVLGLSDSWDLGAEGAVVGFVALAPFWVMRLVALVCMAVVVFGGVDAAGAPVVLGVVAGVALVGTAADAVDAGLRAGSSVAGVAGDVLTAASVADVRVGEVLTGVVLTGVVLTGVVLCGVAVAGAVMDTGLESLAGLAVSLVAVARAVLDSAVVDGFGIPAGSSERSLAGTSAVAIAAVGTGGVAFGTVPMPTEASAR